MLTLGRQRAVVSATWWPGLRWVVAVGKPSSHSEMGSLGREGRHQGRALMKLGHLGSGMSFLQCLGALLIAELSPLCVSKIQGPPASSHLKGP